MKRVLLPEAVEAPARLRLTSEKFKHLRTVLRMDWDEDLEVTDGRGRLFAGRLEKPGSVRLDSLLRSEEPSAPPVELVICLPKNPTMDRVVEKAVECGVDAIRPVVSSRSVVRLPADDRERGKYLRRWQAIADGAVEQSERLWRPEVVCPTPWSEWLVLKTPAHSIAFASETRGRAAEAAALADCWRALSETAGQPVRILIGPEGGLSETELTDLSQAGFSILSLGGIVLRVETAVVAALTLARTARHLK